VIPVHLVLYFALHLIYYDCNDTMKDAVSIADIIALISALAGVVIVVGSMILLYKGIIVLNAVSTVARKLSGGEPTQEKRKRSVPGQTGDVPVAIDVQLGKDIKIKSQYPALGLFILGMLCFFGALWFSKENAPTQMDVQGNVIDSGKYTFTFTGLIGVARPDVKGYVHKFAPKDIEELDVQIGKPGSETDTLVVYPSKRQNGILSFGDYPPPAQAAPQNTKSPVPKPTVDPDQVVPKPTNVVPLQ
jgi:hypothetical protein